MLLPGAGDSSYPLIRAWPFPLQPLISQVPHHLHQGFPGFWKQQCQGAGRVAFQDLTALSHEVEASGPSQGGCFSNSGAGTVRQAEGDSGLISPAHL